MIYSETKNANGSVTCSTIAHGKLCSKTYYGYTKKERRKLFKTWLDSQT